MMANGSTIAHSTPGRASGSIQQCKRPHAWCRESVYRVQRYNTIGGCVHAGLFPDYKFVTADLRGLNVYVRKTIRAKYPFKVQWTCRIKTAEMCFC
jgi:hypothetical protein